MLTFDSMISDFEQTPGFLCHISLLTDKQNF